MGILRWIGLCLVFVFVALMVTLHQIRSVRAEIDYLRNYEIPRRIERYVPPSVRDALRTEMSPVTTIWTSDGKERRCTTRQGQGLKANGDPVDSDETAAQHAARHAAIVDALMATFPEDE